MRLVVARRGAAGNPKSRRAGRAALGVASVIALAAAALSWPASAHTGDSASPELTLVGQSALGGVGNAQYNGEVAVVGATAVVASNIHPGAGVISGMYNPMPCPQTKVKVVDLSNPAKPKRVGNILVREGLVVQDVAALEVATPSFTGDLAAIALAICGGHHDASATTLDRGVAYYDVTDPANPSFLGRYRADKAEFGDGGQEKCDQPPSGVGPEDPTKGPDACASSQHSVHLMQRADGRVLSVSTEPFATASGCFGAGGPCFAGDLRIVDITDPRNPVQIGDFPKSNTALYPTQGLSARPSGFSNNGCRPFSAGRTAELYAGGTKALLAYLDDGVRDVDLSDPTNPTQLGNADPYVHSDPATERMIEGNGGYATIAGPNENLALLSDTDWIAPKTTVRIDAIADGTGPSPQGLTLGSTFACEAMFTLFDPENTAQIYRQAGSQLPAGGGSAQFAYVGRGCPVDEAFGTLSPDPYLKVNGNPVDVAGKIAVVDRFRTSRQVGQIGAGSGCSIAAKAKRAQDNGAIAVVINASFLGKAFSPDGDPTGLSVPVVAVDEPTGARLGSTMCPAVSSPGDCSSTTAVEGALVDSPGQWGGLRIIDLNTYTQVGEYKTPRSLLPVPPDLGVYSVHHAVAEGNRAYVSWNADGVRVLDISNPAAPVEIGHFVPPDVADPNGVLPTKAQVAGVAVTANHIVITDVNYGMYVLAKP